MRPTLSPTPEEIVSKCRQHWSECYYDLCDCVGGEINMNEEVCQDLLGDYSYDIGARLTDKQIKRLVIAVYYGKKMHWGEPEVDYWKQEAMKNK